MYAEVSQEKTERRHPSNKNISVRNIKDQIANLSSNNCSGFKSEFEVRISFSYLISFWGIMNASYNMIYKALSCCKMYH